MSMNKKILEAYNKTKAYYCLDCGKCTANCPVSVYYEGFSPRLLIKNATEGFGDDLVAASQLWDCLTCNTCADRCRSDVQFAEFIRELRSEAVVNENENVGVCSHNGVLQGLMRLQTSSELSPDKLNWVNDDLKLAKSGEVYLFTGCLPIFQTMFEDIHANSVDQLQASVLLLNQCGVTPVVSNQERCCGHDLLWTGDVKSFEKLAVLNAKMLNDLGVKTIITICPEGYLTLKKDYPEFINNNSAEGSEWNFNVVHITEYLAERMKKGQLSFPEENPFNNTSVTYHDSCRLGRFMGVYDAPRELLSAVPGLELREMDHNRNRALCCGVSSWTNCTDISRSIRAERLTEAKDTEADMMITSCPKCQIHFKCYTNNEFVQPQIKLSIEDITVFLAKAARLMKK